ncbi:hypothetical protein BDW74DRAFT_164065 [Aspergillus multicolor]|uniref:uncharacterized protein n=1 Tax=Aspergillus multicolor TaxID=41759 RepID=UPI003CCE291A
MAIPALTMRFKLPSLTICLSTLLLIILTIAFLTTRKPDPIMSASQAEECVDCVHYVSRVEGRILRMKTVSENPQFFRYALDKSCRGQMYLAGHCQKFRREFKKDVARFMVDFLEEEPYEACVAIKSCR